MAHADALPTPNPDTDPMEPQIEKDFDPQAIINVLNAYREEAKNARRSGPNPRDDVWENNWNLYWSRFDFSKKANWQSKHVPPEAPQLVDRWAAAMREALIKSGQWFSVVDPADKEKDLTPHVEKLLGMLLSRCGRTFQGHLIDFAAIFEEQCKMGAIMALCASVTWRHDDEGGFVSVETTDPREVWFDSTGRNLYRRRLTEIDHHELLKLADATDDDNQPLYDKEAIAQLAAEIAEERIKEKEDAAGHGVEQQSTRKPIKIEEWLATVIMPDGHVSAEDALLVVANDKFIIRGPEENPFWHQHDWIVYCPMVVVPLSIYGRSYMEDWGDVARAFVEMTNLILDGTFTSTMKAFAGRPDLLEDPTQINEGVYPNAFFALEEGQPKEFIEAIDLGRLPPEAVTIWQALKNEIREGGKLSEIALGQVPGKKDLTATEAALSSESGSAMITSIARTIEERFLEPLLTMVWTTALQHIDFKSDIVVRELGEEAAAMLAERREEFKNRRFKLRVRAITGLIAQQMLLRQLIQLLGVIGSNELLMAEFLKTNDVGRLVEELIRLHGLDKLNFTLSEREQMVKEVVGKLEQMAGGGQPGAQSGQPAALEAV